MFRSSFATRKSKRKRPLYSHRILRFDPLEDRYLLSGAGIITTVAGEYPQGVGFGGYSGDGGPATAALLDRPVSVALDAAGDLFIADAENHVIREVNATTHVITTVVGNGTSGYTGDNGPASAAELEFPQGLAVDAAGDLFISDTGSDFVVREVHANSYGVITGNSTITTVAGDGTQGYSGDNGAATAAELFTPCALAIDTAGDLFIADAGNTTIREVHATGGVITGSSLITTVAGNGNQGYSGDGGPATSAELFLPDGIALNASGDLFISDYDSNVIREVYVDPTTGVIDSGSLIATVAGDGIAGYSGDSGPASAAEFSGPDQISVDSAGDLLIADRSNNVIREIQATSGTITPGSVISTVAGEYAIPGGYTGDGGQATAAELLLPRDVAVDSSGDLFIADTFNNVVRKVTYNTTGIGTTTVVTASQEPVEPTDRRSPLRPRSRPTRGRSTTAAWCSSRCGLPTTRGPTMVRLCLSRTARPRSRTPVYYRAPA